MDPDTLCLNVDFGDAVRLRHTVPAGHHNRLAKATVA
jgi:hypothetical protein